MSRRLIRVLFAGTFTALSTVGAQKTATFTVTSPDVHAGQKIASPQVFNGMGCTGSYALTVYDPDAPTGSGWWHWVVYNIPASVTKLAAGAGDAKKNLLPAGAAQGNTDFGAPGYGGPCPPAGDKAHHYRFTVFALDTDKLDIPPTATAAYVGFNLHAHTVAKAELTALYSR
jgi:Raf kinase inhibitor-like YbhB/YbcL family protein